LKAADATVITSSVVIGGSAVSGLRRRGIQGRRKVLYGRLRQHLGSAAGLARQKKVCGGGAIFWLTTCTCARSPS
jgi:hypothetical protein